MKMGQLLWLIKNVDDIGFISINGFHEGRQTYAVVTSISMA